MIKSFEKYILSYTPRLVKGPWPTILEMLDISVEEHPDKEAFFAFQKDQRISWTYRELNNKIKTVGSALIEAGVKKGDRIVINGKNSMEWGLAYLSVLYAGAVTVPIDNLLDKDHVQNLARFSGAVGLLCDSDVLSKLDQDDSWFNNLLIKLSLTKSQNFTFINEVQPKSILPRVEKKCTDQSSLLFTSGTTGNEKAVPLTEENLTSNVYQAADKKNLDVTHKDILMAVLPLHHCFCCTAVFLETIMHGASVLFTPSMAPSKLIHDMREGKITVFMGIPLLYNKVMANVMKKAKEKGALAYGGLNFLMGLNGFFRKVFKANPGHKWFEGILDQIGMKHVRICISGAGPLSPKVVVQYRNLGVNFVQGYGMTETSPILTLNPLGKVKPKSVGKVLEEIDMKILDPDLLGIGEIAVKGPNVTTGYWNNEEANKDLFTEDGYLRTGDIGALDKDNYLYIKGRAKNIIVTEGGKNVYPEEIEDLFQTYGEISQVLIRSYIANKGNKAEGIEAVIYPNPENFKDVSKEKVLERVDEIIKEVNSNLVTYKKITNTLVLDEPMETTTTRKIQRNKVLRTFENLLSGK
ncbi:MAG: AMP-binding protein [Sphaerochaetaceae bacterium]|nr:AMP-binding protein [Sphaerochaetaceae bacterium]